MFCSECGQAIPETAKFCENCGTRSTRAEVERQERERIIGEVTAYTGLGTRTVVLLFTTNRLIVASASGLGTYLGLGVVVQYIETEAKMEALSRLEPDGIIASDKKNYAMPYSDIISISIRKPSAWRGGKVTVTTKEGETKFGITNDGLWGLHKNRDFTFLRRLSPVLTDRLTIEG